MLHEPGRLLARAQPARVLDRVHPAPALGQLLDRQKLGGQLFGKRNSALTPLAGFPIRRCHEHSAISLGHPNGAARRRGPRPAQYLWRGPDSILGCFPDADLFALFEILPDEKRGFLGDRDVKTTLLQRLHRLYFPLMPFAIEQLDLSAYDIIISSSYLVAKGVLVGPRPAGHAPFERCERLLDPAGTPLSAHLGRPQLGRGRPVCRELELLCQAGAADLPA